MLHRLQVLQRFQPENEGGTFQAALGYGLLCLLFNTSTNNSNTILENVDVSIRCSNISYIVITYFRLNRSFVLK